MNRRVLLATILVLAFLGLADSVYLTHAALSDTALACGINGLDGCNIVAQSAYSRLFGIPTALYGTVFYGIIFVGSVLLLFRHHQLLAKALFWITALGFLVSLYFLYIQLFLIKAICIYCLGSFVASLLLLGAAWRFTGLEPGRAPENSVVLP